MEATIVGRSKSIEQLRKQITKAAHGTKDILIIGDSAKVKANIESGTIIVSGEVVGNLRALNKMEILAPGRMYGNIITPVLVIEEGVIFQGNCQMEEALAHRETVPEKPDSPPVAG